MYNILFSSQSNRHICNLKRIENLFSYSIHRRLTFKSTCRPSCECRRWKPVTLESIVETIMRSHDYVRSRANINYYISSRKRRHRQRDKLAKRFFQLDENQQFFFTRCKKLEKIFNHFRQKRRWIAICTVIHETHLTESRTILSWRLSRVSPFSNLFPLLPRILFLPLYRATLSDLFLSLLFVGLLWQLGSLIHFLHLLWAFFEL